MRFVACLVVLFACCSCSIIEDIDNSGDVVAQVGDIVITADDLENKLMDRYYGTRSLLGMVRDELFTQEAERRGIAIPEDEIQRRIDEEMVRLFGPEGAQRQKTTRELQQQGLDLDDIRRELRAELASSILIEKVVQANRQFTDVAINDLYEKSYMNDRMLIRHIAFPFNAEGEIDGDTFDRTRDQAENVSDQLLRGGDFATLAKQYSGNEDTANKGGQIGWITPTNIGNADLAQSIFNMGVGEVSEPIREGEYGFHIFRVDGHIPKKELDDVRPELIEQLRAMPPTKEEIKLLEERLRATTNVKVFSHLAKP